MNKTNTLLIKINSVNLSGSFSEETRERYLIEIANNSDKVEALKAFDYQSMLYTMRTQMLTTQKTFRRRARLEKKVERLERHAYAPEMNTLHFKDGSSKRAPQCTTIAAAVARLA